jgi:hypothetical protein
MYRKFLFIIISLQKYSSRDTIPLSLNIVRPWPIGLTCAGLVVKVFGYNTVCRNMCSVHCYEYGTPISVPTK